LEFHALIEDLVAAIIYHPITIQKVYSDDVDKAKSFANRSDRDKW